LAFGLLILHFCIDIGQKKNFVVPYKKIYLNI